jgi:hypothetical protein
VSCTINGSNQCQSCDGGYRPSGNRCYGKGNKPKYIKTSKQKLCHSLRNIKTESECRAAASYLGYAFTKAYNGPNDHPYCHFDHRNLPGRQVFFNTAGNGNGRADLYASVCLASVCSCSNGRPQTGLSCTSHAANQCQSCHGGYWLSRSRCYPNRCSCQNGKPKTGVSCTHGSNQCQSCHGGYQSSGNRCRATTGQVKYIMTAKFELCPSQRNIKTESDCRAAASYLGYAFTKAYRDPNDDQFCHFDHRNLPGRQVFFNMAGHRRSRARYTSICLASVCVCSKGKAKIGTACTSHGAHQCQSCNGGYRLSGSRCYTKGGVPGVLKLGQRDFTYNSQVSWSGSIVSVPAGSHFIDTKQKFTRPIDLRVTIRQLSSVAGCGIVALFPTSTTRHCECFIHCVAGDTACTNCLLLTSTVPI